MRKDVKRLRTELVEFLKNLQDTASTPGVSKIDVGDGFKESFHSFVHTFLPRGELLLKRIDKVLTSLPKEVRPKEKVKMPPKKEKASQRLLALIHQLNPKETEYVYTRGSKTYNSRQECAKLLKEVRKMERELNVNNKSAIHLHNRNKLNKPNSSIN